LHRRSSRTTISGSAFRPAASPRRPLPASPSHPARVPPPAQRGQEPLLDPLTCEELRILSAKFSSGITFKELRSVAQVIVERGHIDPPCRDAKRNFGLLVAWFRRNWTGVLPWLDVIQLRDENDCVIDGMREMIEKGMLPGFF
jgi:hypothetical protein